MPWRFSSRGARALLALASFFLLEGCVCLSAQTEVVGGSGGGVEVSSPCATQVLPSGWPDTSSSDSEALLAPFLSCASPAEFLALQRRVDLPRLVAWLDAWHAVRLGALGPIREDAAHLLNRQRTTFLLQALERYGAAHTEVLARFVVDSSYDDDLREILFLLAQDKRLVEVLEQLPSLRATLEARGLRPLARAERDFQWSDVGRGLDRAGQDALSTSPVVNGARSTLGELYALQAQLPPPYQRALEAMAHAQFEEQWSAHNVMLGVADHMTFGVPLGFYGLVVGTGQGVEALARGRYELAVRQLAPATLLVVLHVGGESAAWLSEARGMRTRVSSGLEGMEARWGRLQEMASRLKGLVGEEGLTQLADSLRASREAGRWVAEGGLDAALALHEARGNVAQAQAMLSRSRPGSTGSSAMKGNAKGVALASAAARPEALAAWVDEASGLTQEVVQAKLAAAESEVTSPRLPMNASVLERQRPSIETPPLEAQGHPRWSEYVAYYERRLGEIKQGTAIQGPLRWDAYERMWGWVGRGLDFERAMVSLLKADAELPRAQRRFLGDFDKPRVEAYVGVKKPDTGLRFADVLVIEQGESAGRPPRIETFSFKSRDFSGFKQEAIRVQMIEDANEALRKYGEMLDIRRDSLQRLLARGREVPVQRVHLVYDGKGSLMPDRVEEFGRAMDEVKSEVPGVRMLVNESTE